VLDEVLVALSTAIMKVADRVEGYPGGFKLALKKPHYKTPLHHSIVAIMKVIVKSFLAPILHFPAKPYRKRDSNPLWVNKICNLEINAMSNYRNTIAF